MLQLCSAAAEAEAPAAFAVLRAGNDGKITADESFELASAWKHFDSEAKRGRTRRRKLRDDAAAGQTDAQTKRKAELDRVAARFPHRSKEDQRQHKQDQRRRVREAAVAAPGEPSTVERIKANRRMDKEAVSRLSPCQSFRQPDKCSIFYG